MGVLEASESIASSAVKTAYDVQAKAIVCLTTSGKTARYVAKYRPQMPILVLTAMGHVARQTQGYFKNCESAMLGSMLGTDSILVRAQEMVKRKGWVKPGDSIVCVYGLREGVTGTTNMMRVITVE
jgi:pyruvate kinase